jgi:hypothetical protein
VINPTQRPLSDNTQYSQQTDVHALAAFETAAPASERPQTDALDRAATGIGSEKLRIIKITFMKIKSSLSFFSFAFQVPILEPRNIKICKIIVFPVFIQWQNLTSHPRI